MAEALPTPIVANRNRTEKELILSSYKQLVKATVEFTTKEERKIIRRAFAFSLDAHKDARRKSGEPYILHPLAVARILVREIGLHDVTSIICALLHDVVEDTFAELADIQREFGEDAAKIIDGLTKISGVFDPGSSKQAENFRKMLLTMSDDIRVAIIKIADRLHNMRTLEHTKRETQLKIASETKSLYAPLAHRLGLYAVKSELEDLALQFTEPDSYKNILNKLQETKVERDRYIQNFIKPIAAKMQSIGLDCAIKGRVKGVNSIYEKMKTQNIPFEEVYDLFAIRIIINSKPEEEKWDCWRAYSAITSTYRPHPERTRDWISIPRASGYESLHVTVMGAKGRWVEVQIRTQRMDSEAEKGLAAHWKYKDSKDKDKQTKGEQALEHWLGGVRDLLENKSLSALDVVSEFKTGLVSEEIYVFTPKGDLKILPQGATALDFAYEIHSKLGHSCIGAKVNQRVVPLSHKLQNGDQVEVLTSKKQQPSPEWLEFVVTRKAIGHIKDELKEQRKEVVAKGKEIFDWKIRHMGLTENHPLVKELLAEFKFPGLQEFFYRLGAHRVDLRRIVEFLDARQQQIVAGKLETALAPTLNLDNPTQLFEALVQHKLGASTDSFVIAEDMAGVTYSLATCCHPIPGDAIVGISEPEKGIVVHRTNCPVAIDQMSSYGHRIVKSRWNDHHSISFLAAFKIVGQDKIGMLNSIVRVVSLIQKINIRSVTIDTEGGMFEGIIKVYISDKSEADRLTENLGKISGVFTVQRLEAS